LLLGRLRGFLDRDRVLRAFGEMREDRAIAAGRECFDRYPDTMRALAAGDPEFERQMAVARGVMRKYPNALRELAKN